MSAAQLHPKHVFGLKADVKGNIAYQDEQTVIYPAGHSVVVYNTETKNQKIIHGTEKTDGITAMAVTSNRKYVAVAERGEKATVTIFDLHTLKRKKVLTTSECASKEFVSICFSQDGKFLLTQGGAPDWTLVLWTWEKSKMMAFVKTSNPPNNPPIYQCSFNPADNSMLCVSGQGICKFFRFVEQNLKPLPSNLGKREPQNYLCHAWVSEERVIVATDTGDLILVEAGEMRAVLPHSPSDGNSIDAVVAFSKGFVCAGDGGVLHIFEKSEDKEYYKRTKTFKIENHAVKIKNLALSPTEETVACTLENNQIFALILSNADLMKVDDMNFEYLCSQMFHQAPITGLDVCIRKPLVATCSVDKSVHIWNYVDKTTDLIKFFPEEAQSIAFHPSGLHVLVGFSDKLRLMNLLMDDIRMYKEIPVKACRECRFSNGGQYFVAVNGNTIQVYSTYTCETIGNLRGHNGKVRSLSWTPDDSKIISAGMDGAVYEWQLQDFKRKNEYVLKGCIYTSAVCTPDGKSIYAVGSDKRIKEFLPDGGGKDFETGLTLNQTAISSTGKLLFAGTEAGTLRSYKLPLTNEHMEYQCHSGPIQRMRVSFDDSLLFSVGDDACLYILNIHDKEVRRKDKEPLAWAEEILVTKSDLEEKQAMMQEYKQKVEELTMQNEYQLRLKDLNYNEKLKEITESFTQQLEQEKARLEILAQDKNDMELEYDEKIKHNDERHAQALQQIEATYQQKIMAEVDRYNQLVQEKEILNDRWEEKNALLVESHERYVAELADEYENKIQELQLSLERIKEERDEQLREFDETKRQIEEDADREIEELKEVYESKLAQEREIGLRLKGENGIMRKKFSALQKDIEDQKEEIKALFDQKKDLYAQIANYEKDIASHKKEIRERDDTIGDKEKRIYDLKKKNQELEKFKFVLDYKIKELKKQIEPRELEIADMKEQIKEMDQELERYHKTNSNLELTINDLKLKIDGMQREIMNQRQQLSDYDAVIRRFRNDLHETVQHIQDPKALKESVKRLYQRHVTERVGKNELDVDIQKEYNRQREYLEKTVETLKRKLNKDMELHKTDTMRIMNENVALIKEINELRREIKGMKQAQRAKELSGANKATKLSAETQKEIEMQREEIRRLRDRIEELEAGNGLSSRPISRQQLPPMDGFQDGEQVDGGAAGEGGRAAVE